jgi:hypothetical protein
VSPSAGNGWRELGQVGSGGFKGIFHGGGFQVSAPIRTQCL